MPDPANPQSGTIARLASQRTKYRDAARAAVKERKAAANQLEEALQQIEGLKKGDASSRVKELEGQLRTLRHRGAFDRMAKARGASDEDLDDLFALSGYKADADEPDEKALGRLLDDQKVHPARKKYFAAATDDEDDDQGEGGRGDGDRDGDRRRNGRGNEELTPGRREPSPDSGRGRRTDGKGTVFLTRDQLSDPKFMLDPRNAQLKLTAKIRD